VKSRGGTLCCLLFTHGLRYVWRYWQLRPWMFGALVVLRIVTSLVDVACLSPPAISVDTVATQRPRSRPPPCAGHALAIVFIFQSCAARSISAHPVSSIPCAPRPRCLRQGPAFLVDGTPIPSRARRFAGSPAGCGPRYVHRYDDFQLHAGDGCRRGDQCGLLIRWPLLGLLITGEIFVYLGVSIGPPVAWVGPASSVAQRYDSRISANLADCIGANQVVKSFAAEIREDQRFARLLQGWKARARIAWAGGPPRAWRSRVLIAMQATMLGMGLCFGAGWR